MKTIAKERTTLVWAGKGRNRVKSAPRTKTWYRRVSDELAARAVADKGWRYCPKEEWRGFVRDKGIAQDPLSTELLS